MTIQLPLSLTDGTATISLSRAGSLPGGVLLHDAAGAYNAKQVFRIQHTDQKRGKRVYRRQVVELSRDVEDTSTDELVALKAMLILDIPITVATKAMVTQVLKMLLDFFSQDPPSGNPGDYIASFVNLELP